MAEVTRVDLKQNCLMKIYGMPVNELYFCE